MNEERQAGDEGRDKDKDLPTSYDDALAEAGNDRKYLFNYWWRIYRWTVKTWTSSFFSLA